MVTEAEQTLIDFKMAWAEYEYKNWIPIPGSTFIILTGEDDDDE